MTTVECGLKLHFSYVFGIVAVRNMKRSMNDGGGDYGAKRRSTGGSVNDMRILLPSQVLAFV